MRNIIPVFVTALAVTFLSGTSPSPTDITNLMAMTTSVPIGAHIPVTKTINLAKDNYYIISGVGYLKPDIASLYLPKCLQNKFSKDYDCKISIRNPYTDVVIDGKAIPIDNFSCAATTQTDFITTCLAKSQFIFNFAFQASADVKDAQVFFENTSSNISYQECGVAASTYKFPVSIMQNTKITLQERKK